MSAVLLKKEPKVDCMAFSQNFTPLPFDRDWSVSKMVDYVKQMDFDTTDCAQPMLYALEKRKEFDVFIVYTDSETYSGDVHPFEALKVS